MSVKIMGIVWEADLPQREKFVLLAYADHADHDGNNVYPSIGLIAWKTGYEPRSIQRITKVKIDKNILIPSGSSKYGTNKYSIAVDMLPRLSPYLGGDKLSGGRYGGDILSGVRQGGGDILTPGGDILTPGGDIAVSPDPSFKPSIKPSYRTVEEEYKERLKTALVVGGIEHIQMQDRFFSCFHINIDWDRKDGKNFLKWLKDRPHEQSIESFSSWWYANDWRGKQGQAPSIDQIKTLWPQAFVVKRSPVIYASEVY